MQLDVISLIVNIMVLVAVLSASGIYIWRLKLGSKNDVLLFILFTVYWMAPLMCREYTGQMHIAMNNVAGWSQDGGVLLWLPLTVYGIAGLIYRPMTDVLSYKMKSRKNIIYISLAIQFGTMLPMFFSQSLATNIIQSIGTGIGASIIGAFNLMFSEEKHGRKIFRTVSIMAVPPLLAELVTGGLKSIVCSFLPEHEDVYADGKAYLDIMKYIWLAAVVCVAISLILTILVKEDKKLFFHDLKLREPVEKKADWTVVALVAIVATCLGFTRWICAGPSTVSQFVFLGEIKEVVDDPTIALPVAVPTKYMEGYISVIFAFGQLAGVGVASLALQKRQKNAKWILVTIGSLIYLLYLNLNTIENENFLNGYVYFSSNFLAGLAYGLIFPVIIGIMLNKHFNKVNIITPVGVFNTCLALGITGASVFNNVLKGSAFDLQIYKFEDFIKANHTVNSATAFIVIAMAIVFVISYIIHTKFPPKATNIGVRYNSGYEMEI